MKHQLIGFYRKKIIFTLPRSHERHFHTKSQSFVDYLWIQNTRRIFMDFLEMMKPSVITLKVNVKVLMYMYRPGSSNSLLNGITPTGDALGLACVLMLKPISPELDLFRTSEYRTSLCTCILLNKDNDQQLYKEEGITVAIHRHTGSRDGTWCSDVTSASCLNIFTIFECLQHSDTIHIQINTWHLRRLDIIWTMAQSQHVMKKAC